MKNLIKKTEEDIQSMKNELQQYYCEVGRAVLEIAEAGNKKVNNLVDRIIEAEIKLRELRKNESHK